MIEEIWKDVAGYEGRYQVSNLGNIKSIERKVCIDEFKCRLMPERVMKLHEWHGYQVIWLRMPGSHKKFYVHRLVAFAFLEQPEGKEYVNHKNKNRCHNSTDNLEWCTHQENCDHRDGKINNDEPF